MKKGKSLSSLEKEYNRNFFEQIEEWVFCHPTFDTILNAFYMMDKSGKREYLVYLYENHNENVVLDKILSAILRYAEIKI